MAHLLEFDSVHGRWNHEIQADSEGLTVDGRRIAYSSREQQQGLIGCLWWSTLFVLAAGLLSLRLPRLRAGDPAEQRAA